MGGRVDGALDARGKLFMEIILAKAVSKDLRYSISCVKSFIVTHFRGVYEKALDEVVAIGVGREKVYVCVERARNEVKVAGLVPLIEMDEVDGIRSVMVVEARGGVVFGGVDDGIEGGAVIIVASGYERHFESEW